MAKNTELDLDLEVATKVLKWTVKPACEIVPSFKSTVTQLAVDLGDQKYRWLPPFSSDIGYAWEIVSKLQAEGLFVKIEAIPGNADRVDVFVFDNYDQTKLLAEAMNGPVAQAICLAAIEAKKHEINEAT